MAEKATASLVFPVLCLLVSFAIFCFVYRTEVLQQVRAYSRSARSFLRETRRKIAYLSSPSRTRHHETFEDEYFTIFDVMLALGDTELDAYSETQTQPSDLKSGSEYESDGNSDDLRVSTELEYSISHALRQPPWITESSRHIALHLLSEQPPLTLWEIELEERIRHGRGIGPWLDRIIDRVVRHIVENFNSDEY